MFYLYVSHTWYQQTVRMQVVDDREEGGLEEALSCPISFQLMTDPVMADDGQTYQREAIEQWIDKCTAGKRYLLHRC
jgi:pyridoxal/pyridoxine/pyridoxamine kinase